MTDFEREKFSIKKTKVERKEKDAPSWVYMDGSVSEPIDWRTKGIETPVYNLGQCDDPYIYAAVEEMSMGHSIRAGLGEVTQLSI